MDYPAKLKLSILSSHNEEYEKTQSHLRRIRLLSEGGFELREAIGEFLKQRASEEREFYRLRLEKFTYSNTLGSSLSQLVSRFSNGVIHLGGINDERAEFWQRFREDNDSCGRTEKNFTTNLFSLLLRYQHVYVHIDKPSSAYRPMSAADEEALGLKPRLVTYDPMQVTGWSEHNGQLQWIKVFQVSDWSESPLQKPMQLATWTFIDSETIARYSAFVKMRNGKIFNILDRQGNVAHSVDGETLIHLDEGHPIAHGYGEIPVVKVAIDKSHWAGDQAASKAEECLRLECHRHDYLTAAYPQRIYKKPAATEDDLAATFADDGDGDEIETSLSDVLELDSFSWNEPTGEILTKMNDSLISAQKDIRSIVSIGGAYIQEASEASGRSKEMDFENENERLSHFGHVITDALQRIYRLAALSVGDLKSASELSVSGLDEFSTHRLSTLLASLKALLEIDMSRLEAVLTPTLYLLVRSKLMNFLVSNLTPQEKAQIEQELKDMPELEGDIKSQIQAAALEG